MYNIRVVLTKLSTNHNSFKNVYNHSLPFKNDKSKWLKPKINILNTVLSNHTKSNVHALTIV